MKLNSLESYCGKLLWKVTRLKVTRLKVTRLKVIVVFKPQVGINRARERQRAAQPSMPYPPRIFPPGFFSSLVKLPGNKRSSQIILHTILLSPIMYVSLLQARKKPIDRLIQGGMILVLWIPPPLEPRLTGRGSRH